ncbi:hypothetical protein M514_19075, partial [Trichuris suis]
MPRCLPKGRELERRGNDTRLPSKQENVATNVERKHILLLQHLLKNAAVSLQNSCSMEDKLSLQQLFCDVGSNAQKKQGSFEFTNIPPKILDALKEAVMEQLSELEESITKLVSVLYPDFASRSVANGDKNSALDFVINYLRNGYHVKSDQLYVEQLRELLLQFDTVSRRREESSSGSCRVDAYIVSLSAESLFLRKEAEFTLAEAEAKKRSLYESDVCEAAMAILQKELDELEKQAADLEKQVADKKRQVKIYKLLAQQPSYQQLFTQYKLLKEELELYKFVIENVPD